MPACSVGHEPTGGAHPVDPAGVGAAVDDLRLIEQIEQEALVRRAALDDDRRVGQRPAQPRQSLVTGAAVGNDLGDHRVEVRRDEIALADPRVHADAGAGGQAEQGDPARRGGEVAVGVLGVEPALDGVPELRRRLALEPAARGHVQLRLHQIEARRHLGDRVLDLEPGVHLEEREGLVGRLVQELDRARAAVADGQDEPLGGFLDLQHLLVGQHRGGGLLDHLLVASLQRAVPHAERPGGALPVGDDLHLDVARAGDQALEEDHTAAKGTGRLVTGALERVDQLLVGGHHPDAASTTARRRLEHEGVADLLHRAPARTRRRRRRPGSTERPGRPPPRRAAWRRSCRPAAASRPRSDR